MPKFLTGCHNNEEEISRHLKQKKEEYWPAQLNGNKFEWRFCSARSFCCPTGQILENPVEVVKGRILVGWAQKSPEPKDEIDFKVQEAKKA